jgi:hypothetical protein
MEHREGLVQRKEQLCEPYFRETYQGNFHSYIWNMLDMVPSDLFKKVSAGIGMFRCFTVLLKVLQT